MRTIVQCALACIVVLGPGCTADPDAVADNASGAGATEPGAETTFRFTDVSAASSIALDNVSGGPEKMAIPSSLGQGAAAIDYDADGDLDLFIVNGDVYEGTPRAEPRPALYRNLGGFRFEDVTREAGLMFGVWAHGATAVDFDADGHSDLYVTGNGEPNRFFRNRGDGTFEDRSAVWGAADPGPSTAAAFFDADQDGDLDLYVGNYVYYDPDDPPNDGLPCNWRGVKVYCGPRGTPPVEDRFYENRDGRLEEAGAAFGFDQVKPSYTLGAVTGDFDNDGDVDLYLTNDSRANYLFENRERGSFREVGWRYGADRNEDGLDQAGMGVDFGDVDNDGRFDIFVTNFSHDTNTLYRNFVTPGGETMFEDSTNMVNLGIESYTFLSWGTRIVDLDNDGWQDIVVVSGHVYPQVERLPLGTSYDQPNQVFRNLGPRENGRPVFAPVEIEPGDAFEKSQASRGLVAADLDNDGDHDFLIVEIDAPPTLIRNDTTGPGHWIGFLLRGPGENMDAIGARLEIEDGLGVLRWRERTSGGSYLSTGDPRLHVGLGPAASAIRQVTVRWPSGDVAVYRDLEVDRYWLLAADSSEAVPSAP